jgi:hypothetical protein
LNHEAHGVGGGGFGRAGHQGLGFDGDFHMVAARSLKGNLFLYFLSTGSSAPSPTIMAAKVGGQRKAGGLSNDCLWADLDPEVANDAFSIG